MPCLIKSVIARKLLSVCLGLALAISGAAVSLFLNHSHEAVPNINASKSANLNGNLIFTHRYYQNNSYKLEIPVSWEGRYLVEERPGCASFYFYQPNSLGSQGKQFLFGIYTYDKVEWDKAKRDVPEDLSNQSEITSRNNLVFVLAKPLNNHFNDGKLGEGYRQMSGDIDEVIKTFEVL